MSENSSLYEYFVNDVLLEVEGISSRKLFGGYALYRYGIVFSILAFGKIYFKVGTDNNRDFDEYNSEYFQYQKKGKIITMSYRVLPDEILEDRSNIEEWIEKAVYESMRAKGVFKKYGS